MLIVTDASILDGSCLLFIDITLAIFFYINVVEREMTVTVILNFCFVMVHVHFVLSFHVPDT